MLSDKRFNKNVNSRKQIGDICLLLFAEILAACEFDRNFFICHLFNFPIISHSILIRFARFLDRFEAFIKPEELRASSTRNDRYFIFLEKWAPIHCFRLDLKNGGRD